MMTLSRFLKKIKRIEEIEQYVNDLSKLTGFDIINFWENGKLYNSFIETMKEDFNDSFGMEAWDWIDWWTNDKKKNPTLQAFDKNGNEIDTLDKLYFLLKNGTADIEDIEEDKSDK